MKFSKSILTAAVIISFLTAASFAAPAWRGDLGSTWQQWDFTDNNPTPSPDDGYNPYNPAQMQIVGGNYQPTVSDGAWQVSGSVYAYIPNSPDNNPHKEIWVEVIWQPMNSSLFLPDEPMVGVTPFADSSTKEVTPLAGDWYSTLFKLDLSPNPSEEYISLSGDYLVDQIVIDTICIPEPTTVLLLVCGVVPLLRRRK